MAESRYFHRDSGPNCRTWYNTNYTDINGYTKIKDFEEEYWNKYELSKYFDSNDSVLDVGCGNGRYSNFLSTRVKDVTAIDPIMKVNESFLQDRQNIKYSKSDFDKFQGDFDENTGPEYDVLFMADVLCLFTMKSIFSGGKSEENHRPEGLHRAMVKATNLIKKSGYIVMTGHKERIIGDKDEYLRVTHKTAFPRAGDVGAFPVDYPWEPENIEQGCGRYNLPFLCNKYGFEMLMFGPSRHPRKFCAALRFTGEK